MNTTAETNTAERIIDAMPNVINLIGRRMRRSIGCMIISTMAHSASKSEKDCANGEIKGGTNGYACVSNETPSIKTMVKYSTTPINPICTSFISIHTVYATFTFCRIKIIPHVFTCGIAGYSPSALALLVRR